MLHNKEKQGMHYLAKSMRLDPKTQNIKLREYEYVLKVLQLLKPLFTTSLGRAKDD